MQRWSRAEQSVDLARLRIATVTRGDLERDVAAEGRIVAANHPRLYSPAEGTVSLLVRAGQTVRKGQALATIESPELESQLAQERSRLQSLESELGRARISARQQNVGNDQTAELRRVRLEAARRELGRAEKLRSEGLFNEVEHERAKDAVRLAEVELDQSREGSRLQREALDFEVTDSSRQVERQRLVVAELERRVRELAVAAPFDGQVATVDVDDRQAVSPNAPLLTVVDLSTYEVEIRIPEAYADEIGPGTRVEIDYAGRKFPGTLTAVSPEVRESQVEGTVVFATAPASRGAAPEPARLGAARARPPPERAQGAPRTVPGERRRAQGVRARRRPRHVARHPHRRHERRRGGDPRRAGRRRPDPSHRHATVPGRRDRPGPPIGEENIVLKMENVTRIYRTGLVETRALRDFSLTVEEGEFVTITGPSGSGKTTFLNVAGLLDTFDQGTYFLDGLDVSRLSDAQMSRIRNEKIGFIFQSFNLIPDLDVFDNIDVPLRYRKLSGKERKERIERAATPGGALVARCATCRRSSRAASSSAWRSPACWPAIPS